MGIVKQVMCIVWDESKKPTSKYGIEPFKNHFIPTTKHAIRLANVFNADREVVIISALIHDIGSIMMGRHNHHITGAEIAEMKLRELGYPELKVQHVKKCVFHHRGSERFKAETLEEQIVAEADAMSAFDKVHLITCRDFSKQHSFMRN